MKILEPTPCTNCRVLIALPFLTVDNEAFCSWKCYYTHINKPTYKEWLQLELRYDEDHIQRGVD